MLTGFKDAIHAVFPKTEIQRCIIHQIRHSLQYVVWKDRKAFVTDLKQIYQAGTREEAESQLLQLGETWSSKYAIAVKSWENNWEDLATFFQYPSEIRRLIYTTNAIEGYNRGLRKVGKTRVRFLHQRQDASYSTWPTRILPRPGRGPSKLGEHPKPVSDSVCRAFSELMNNFSIHIG